VEVGQNKDLVCYRQKQSFRQCAPAGIGLMSNYKSSESRNFEKGFHFITFLIFKIISRKNGRSEDDGFLMDIVYYPR